MRWLLIAIIASGTTVGDLLQSKAMKGHGEVHDFRPGAIVRTLLKVLRDWRILAAVIGYAVAFFAFFKLLSIADVSFAVPATASSYVVETILAKYLLKERVSWQRWAGALLVACGVALLSLWPPSGDRSTGRPDLSCRAGSLSTLANTRETPHALPSVLFEIGREVCARVPDGSWNGGSCPLRNCWPASASPCSRSPRGRRSR